MLLVSSGHYSGHYGVRYMAVKTGQLFTFAPIESFELTSKKYSQTIIKRQYTIFMDFMVRKTNKKTLKQASSLCQKKILKFGDLNAYKII